MKIPCELIVWYVLPSIRRELARELVEKHHISQAEVARRFGVTDAAISQYLKAKRGTSKEIENSGKYEEFKKEVEVAAVRIMNGSDIVTETCRICEMVKKSGMLVKVYENPHRAQGTGLRLPGHQDPPHLSRLVLWYE